MKRSLRLIGLLIGRLVVAGAATAAAQPPPGGPGPRPPLIEALDANHDGKISADELKNATAALAALDRNQDGALSEEEYRPPMRGQGGPGGRPGAGNQSGTRQPGGARSARAGAPDERPSGPAAEGRGQQPGGNAGGSGQPSPEIFVDHALEFDADQDGKLDKEELKKFAETMIQARNGGGAATGPRGLGGGPDGAGPAKGEPGVGSNGRENGDAAVQAPLEFSGGYETDPRDRGRPVVLIAAALGVSSDVFREVFTHVRPAAAGTEPDPEQVRRNKAALMEGLSKYGISNSRLDTVSNYYRYPPGRGERWRTTPASGYAWVENGKVVRFVVTNGGSGYSSPPSVNVKGLPGVAGRAKLSFGKDFSTNGSISEITLAEE